MRKAAAASSEVLTSVVRAMTSQRGCEMSRVVRVRIVSPDSVVPSRWRSETAAVVSPAVHAASAASAVSRTVGLDDGASRSTMDGSASASIVEWDERGRKNGEFGGGADDDDGGIKLCVCAGRVCEVSACVTTTTAVAAGRKKVEDA